MPTMPGVLVPYGKEFRKKNNEIPHFVPVENAESCRSFIPKSGACDQYLPSTCSANFAEEKQKNDF